MGQDIGRNSHGIQAAQMLREVVDGDPSAVVAARWGLSRSGVDRRVKRLAADLTRAVGVEGLRETGAAFVKRLRLHRAAVLEALERFDPAQLSRQREARVLSIEEVELGARRLRCRANRPAHDLALYHLLFATGLRPLEVARLEVRDYLGRDGRTCRESRVRQQVAINGRERPLFFAHRPLEESLAAYLDERLHAGHGLAGVQGWRGLDPRSPLFLGVDGEYYPITLNGEPGQRRFVCRPLLEAYRRIFRQAALPGLCAQSARLTLMARMHERGADESQIGLVLGISDRSAVRVQMSRSRASLADVMDGLGGARQTDPPSAARLTE
jgi:integrase